MQLAPDADEHLIEMPFVAGTWPMPLQRVGELLPEAKAPLTEPIIEVRSDERCAGLAADGLVRFTAGAARDEAEGSSLPKLVVVCGAIMASYGGSFGLFDTLLLPLAVDAAAVPACTAPSCCAANWPAMAAHSFSSRCTTPVSPGP